ncbi:TIGR01777 family oxidoreductase [Amphritea sp. 2_MG-2023]|uniref:TIGR01777 family oxidoreductase n=1 Tax=Amphritea TaxID=515417 RepID=UPI001C07C945|nr:MULTISPECIES: TIGR01777 family oxidoreductase [Amphritea]MBU2966278.1 TIGR01777 family oxidoreductase [Amphritea atlantica]MDO6420217.1 TIGR01777 family oxidoreductase [Amphritea sp. 2_MG-2023]
MKVLITGATGFIGGHLVPRLLQDGHELIIMSRSAQKAQKQFGTAVRVITRPDQIQSDEQVDGIINLAGAGIADKRWNEARKKVLVDSRVEITNQLISLISRLEHKPEVMISGSAIGYYGCRDDDLLLDEHGDVVEDFTHTLCQRWESEALKAQAMNVRVCLIRTGIVLGPGGALAKMLPPFRLGLGGPVAEGQQWMSWIHLDDQLEVICMLLTHDQFSGAFNLTAPEAVTNATFSRQLAAMLSRPAWFRVPAFVLKLILGEGSDLLVKGQRVYPQRLLDAGYQFAYPKLKDALQQIKAPK